MNIKHQVFGNTSPSRRTLYFVVKKTEGNIAKICLFPAHVKKFSGDTWSCGPDWERFDEALQSNKYIKANIGWEDDIPFLEVKGHLLLLCGREDERDLFNPQ
ncbi:hypothetical protein A9K97_gp021 [Tokyovirus A1]|uniref:hypothetical protein n=1 Tax=Tokyovirus A1 TaxID=1826170 RepID=UPI0007A972DF|nr:hypothetical protein A9K97_gp021 [Tokyovirus A1]BAU80330.1 hypothetical protein [Tokyovirus A1]